MAKKNDSRTNRLTDWVILVFVLVVMGLIIADISDNVRDEADRHVSISPEGR